MINLTLIHRRKFHWDLDNLLLLPLILAALNQTQQAGYRHALWTVMRS
jgi:hypothetical protein